MVFCVNCGFDHVKTNYILIALRDTNTKKNPADLFGYIR